MLKNMAIGIDDFAKLREENYSYIDKSMLIEELLKDKYEATLIARPRRFGKSLNMSMLRYFFDIREKDRSHKLFEGLAIQKSPYYEKRGEYPVIFLSLKGIEAPSWEGMLNRLAGTISKLYTSFYNDLAVLFEHEIDTFNKTIKEELEPEKLASSLLFLTNFLNRH